jgi:nitrogen fixation NifU-like protein
MNIDNLYQKNIMEHYHTSPYRGVLESPTFTTDQTSPSCGDRIVFSVLCTAANSDVIISDIKFYGEGSVIGQAAASMLCAYTKNKSFDAVLALTIQDVMQWLGIELGPTRQRTVLFILQALQKGITDYAQSRKTV